MNIEPILPTSLTDEVGSVGKPRKPWLALVFALVCVPAGFAYVGRLTWGIAFIVLTVGGMAIAGWSGFLTSFQGIWVAIVLGCAVQIAAIVFVCVTASSQRRSYAIRWYNRWYVYSLVAFAASVSFLALLMNREGLLGYATYRISSGSMTPTADVGDLIVVDTRLSTVASIGVGDLVTSESIRRPGEITLRRVVAAGGDRVLIDEEGLHVNGVVQPHVHQQGSDLMAAKWMLFPDVELGPDQLYLMGDNRGNSFDSRTEGPYSRSLIRGKATAIWWPPGSQRAGALPTP